VSCPKCHDASKFQDRRDKTFVSLVGVIVLQGRASYYCPACHAGHVPLDAELGFTAARLTPAAEEVVTLAGTRDSFADAVEKSLPKMAGLRLSESTVERTTEAAGQRLGTVGAQGHTLGPAADWRWNHDAQGRTVAYVSVDARGSACRARGEPRLTAAWSGWARSSTPTPNAPRAPRSRIRPRPATKPD
jgi:hypothetical protein